MQRRKIVKGILILLNFGVLLGGISPAHVAQGHWHKNIWLVKTDVRGNMEWQQTYGGSQSEEAYAVIETADGSFALAGYTRSYGAGERDAWLVKADAHGNIEWQQAYGGSEIDGAHTVIEMADGGYALAGYTQSFGTGDFNDWLVKTDARGEVEWTQTYSGSEGGYIYSGIQTADGGFALAGYTYSYGASDFWLVKTDAHGNMEWQQTYGDVDIEKARAVIQTADGGFVLAGYTDPDDTGYFDAWLVKTDACGNKEWTRTYGGSDRDEAYSVIETADGGFALAGYTRSYGAGERDAWLVKADALGNIEWQQTYGGSDYDGAHTMIETADGSFAFAGYTESYGAGGRDFWLVKTDTRGNMEWQQTYGGSQSEEAYAVIEMADGGFALTGFTYSYEPPDTTPPTVTLISPQHTTYTTHRIPVYATNTTEPVYRAWWRFWNGSWSTNQTLTWNGAEDQWEAGDLTWLDGSYQVQVFFTDRGDNEGFATQGFTVETTPPPPADTTPPIVSSPADIAYEEGMERMTGYFIAWTVGDRYPGTYDLLSNTSVWVDSASWTNGTIIWKVEGLAPGAYNITLVVRDAAHNHALDTIWVTVFAAAVPELSAPEDIVYEEGTTGHIITWTVGDRYPGTYAIYTNSGQVDSGSWTNGTIPWNIDGFPQGIYNVTLVIQDAIRNSISDTVLVTVTAPAPDVTTPTTPLVPELSVISTLMLLSLVALATLGVRRKRPKH